MVWSYSRVSSFDDCPYRFFLKYIKGYDETEKFYASFGSFIHKLLEQFYQNKISKQEMLITFLSDFSQEVRGMRPNEKIVQNYINAGRNYLKNFTPLPYDLLDVEKKIQFKIDDYKFIGFIDYLGKKNGDIYLVDNKSRNLKPRSNRDKPTASDKELDKMLRQLYLYSIAVKEEYGKYPKSLCFNCFRNGIFIEEPFKIEKLQEAKSWAIQCIKEIENAEDFPPNRDFFSCFYICGVNDHCEYDIRAREEKKRS